MRTSWSVPERDTSDKMFYAESSLAYMHRKNYTEGTLDESNYLIGVKLGRILIC